MRTPSQLALGSALAFLVLACTFSRKDEDETREAALPGRSSTPAETSSAHEDAGGEGADELDSLAHEQAVMKSSYCATCHPAIYAEHEQNTHGRAFTDEEVRLATGRFSQGDCIICHTPRPVFETGMGQNPTRRYYGLEEGNTCMTCHWQKGVDYAHFTGGPDCRTAFDPRVGTVEACASCHRNHGTPYQWEHAPRGRASGRVCIDCHMPVVTRPIAVGGEVRDVYSHVFPGGRNESQLRLAYRYEAELEGNEVVVRITNKGAGHNFPTELKQRAVESLVIVRDAKGAEVARSRVTFRDPYKRPYGLTLPVNTQIPSGQTREHRVPIGVSDGTVECELHYKLYFPIEDNHPELARRLEAVTLPFSGLEPSDADVTSDPAVGVVTPDGITPEEAGPANLVDFARPAIDQVAVEIPEGDTHDDIDRLIALFQFPVPQANVEARKRLAGIGAPAVDALIRATGSWDNKTWNQAMGVLAEIAQTDRAAVAGALRTAVTDDELYVRVHALELCGRLGLADAELLEIVRTALERPTPLDRSAAAATLGTLGDKASTAALRRLVREDRDPDVVRAAAQALLALDERAAAPEIRAALERFAWPETRRDLARALAALGDPYGVQVLLAGLDGDDDLIRESYFEAFFDVTGVHLCYEPLGPRDERLAALSALQAWWSEKGGTRELRRPARVSAAADHEAQKIIAQIGGSDGTIATGDDIALRGRLIELGPNAVPAIVGTGLKYPPGFSNKRAILCDVLGEIGDPAAVPALVAALRDPVASVAAWACDALGRIADTSALPALRRYHQRLLSLASQGRIPASAGSPEALIALSASQCYRLGDETVESDLAGFLLSADEGARLRAYDALAERWGANFAGNPNADLAERRAGLAAWLESR